MSGSDLSRQAPTQRARDEASKAARRQKILMAALERFYDKGYMASRMDDIAADAGLSKGTLYLYFKSKESIFEALIAEIALPKIAMFEQHLTEDISLSSFLDRFALMAPQILRHSALPRLVKVLISDASHFPAIVNLYREKVIKRALSLMSKALAKATARGEIQVDDPDLTARLLVAPMAFSLLWVVIFEQGDSEQLDVAALIKQHKEFLMKALAAQSPTSESKS